MSCVANIAVGGGLVCSNQHVLFLSTYSTGSFNRIIETNRILTPQTNICRDGYCTASDDGGEWEGDEQDGEGTGMGDGVGNEDVSNEIDNEEQLMGDNVGLSLSL